MYTKIEKCRICGNDRLELVLDLGVQTLTGVFPRSVNEKITSGPLRLVKCTGEDVCGLLQLQHSYNLGEMYGQNYGYRSGLNESMVKHLHSKVEKILKQVTCEKNDLIIDIGSNDSTTLQAYSQNLNLVGIDPTGVKFRGYYPDHIKLIPDFFSAKLIKKEFPDRKAKVVTSFSMFYDLEDPISFMKEVYEILADDGIWVFEQSYMPSMLETNSFDTVCHEHLEFYALQQIKWMADIVGFNIIDVEFNDINGGSFSITVAKSGNPHFKESAIVKQIIEREKKLGLHMLHPYIEFADHVKKFKCELIDYLKVLKQQGKKVGALGASTKGNVLLQYCELSSDDIIYVAEVNQEKYGRFTPGSNIPIISEEEMLLNPVDYLIVLPWHFKRFFLESNKFNKSKLIFPLPKLEIV